MKKTICMTCAALALAAMADGTVLWPSPKTKLLALPDSSIQTLPDGSMGVTTGVKHRWPGVHMDFIDGECDLSMYGRVTIAVSNTTDKATAVHLSVKGRTTQGRTPGGNVRLAPWMGLKG